MSGLVFTVGMAGCEAGRVQGSRVRKTGRVSPVLSEFGLYHIVDATPLGVFEDMKQHDQN